MYFYWINYVYRLVNGILVGFYRLPIDRAASKFRYAKQNVRQTILQLWNRYCHQLVGCPVKIWMKLNPQALHPCCIRDHLTSFVNQLDFALTVQLGFKRLPRESKLFSIIGYVIPNTITYAANAPLALNVSLLKIGPPTFILSFGKSQYIKTAGTMGPRTHKT
jgi:hypothetical protein